MREKGIPNVTLFPTISRRVGERPKNRPTVATQTTISATATVARALAFSLAVTLAASADEIQPVPAPQPERTRLRAHVATLASPAFEGRRGGRPGGDRTAEFVASRLRSLGLKPLFGPQDAPADTDYFQTIPDPDDPKALPWGKNVGARLEGGDPALRDRCILVSAHFDHLGVRRGELYPGADDNASGVAMLLEVARCLVESPEKPRRSVLFVSFDLEEVGLFGSRYMAEHMPVPMERLDLVITADMIGRSFAGIPDKSVFVMGLERAPRAVPWVEASARELPIEVGPLGSDLLLLDRSDYGPFRLRRVPYLFFTTGETPVYHTPRDVPETLDYPKLEAISRLILGVTRSAAAADPNDAPRWTSPPVNPLAEAVTIGRVIDKLLAHQAALDLNAAQLLIMRNAARTAAAAVERGRVEPNERGLLINAARIILASVRPARPVKVAPTHPDEAPKAALKVAPN